MGCGFRSAFMTLPQELLALIMERTQVMTRIRASATCKECLRLVRTAPCHLSKADIHDLAFVERFVAYMKSDGCVLRATVVEPLRTRDPRVFAVLNIHSEGVVHRVGASPLTYTTQLSNPKGLYEQIRGQLFAKLDLDNLIEWDTTVDGTLLVEDNGLTLRNAQPSIDLYCIASKTQTPWCVYAWGLCSRASMRHDGGNGLDYGCHLLRAQLPAENKYQCLSILLNLSSSDGESDLDASANLCAWKAIRHQHGKQYFEENGDACTIDEEIHGHAAWIEFLTGDLRVSRS